MLYQVGPGTKVMPTIFKLLLKRWCKCLLLMFKYTVLLFQAAQCWALHVLAGSTKFFTSTKVCWLQSDIDESKEAVAVLKCFWSECLAQGSTVQ